MTALDKRELTKTTKGTDRVDIFGLKGEQIDMKINLEGQAHIMNLLTDLYENPIEATIRETVSNAIDAVVENGSGEVFITSPTIMDPAFTVRDTGVGMSEDEVRNIYSMYGASTKADDFNQIGAFGLGAKAPLSYCSEFTVRTVKDGKAIEMTVSKQAEGNKVELFELENVNEGSGTTVKIPVTSDDISSFVDVLRQYRELPEMPVSIYLDEELVGHDESVYMLIDENFQLAKNTYGKIWVRRENLKSFLSGDYFGGWSWSQKQKVDYLLSGWKYASSVRAYLLVEIKPGVLNFSSSRDEITKDERLAEMESAVELHTDKLRQNIVERISNEEYKHTKDILHRLVEIRYDLKSDGDKLSLNSEVDVYKDFEIEDIKSSDGLKLKEIMDGEKNAYCSLIYQNNIRRDNLGVLDHVLGIRYANITEMNNYIKEIVDNDLGFNINEVFFRDSDKLLVITEVSPKNIDKFMMRRRSIAEEYNGYRIVLTWKTKDEIKKDINKVGLDALDKVVFAELDVLNDEILEEARKARQARVSEYEDGIYGRLCVYNHSEEDFEYIRDEKFYSTEEIVNEKYYVLFTRHLSKYTMMDELRGFSNVLLLPDGRSIENLDGKKILFVDRTNISPLRAKTYSQLDPKYIGVNTEIPNNSKSAKELSETRRYSRANNAIAFNEDTKREIIALSSLYKAGVSSSDLRRIIDYSELYEGVNRRFLDEDSIPDLKSRVEISDDLIDKIESLLWSSRIYYDLKNVPSKASHFKEISKKYRKEIRKLTLETHEALLEIGLDMMECKVSTDY